MLPLASTVEQIQTNEGFTIEELTWPAGSYRDIILPDQLHPTTEGTIALMQLALRHLDAASDAIDSDDYRRDPVDIKQRLTQEAFSQARAAGMPVKSPAASQKGESKPD